MIARSDVLQRIGRHRKEKEDFLATVYSKSLESDRKSSDFYGGVFGIQLTLKMYREISAQFKMDGGSLNGGADMGTTQFVEQTWSSGVFMCPLLVEKRDDVAGVRR